MSRRSGRHPKPPSKYTDSIDLITDSSPLHGEINCTPVLPPVPPRPRGRGRPRTKSPSTKEDDDDDPPFVVVEGGLSRTVMKNVAKAVTRESDDKDPVVCGDPKCGKKMTMREFKLHNIQCHVNTACTVEEKEGGLVMDHKYFARKINEYKKLTKLTVFPCPKQCGVKQPFKSALGLAYHINTCGRTKEELDAVLIECETCHERLTLPKMQWHRKQHEEKPVEEHINILPTTSGLKRKSAVVARKSFRKAAEKEAGGDDDSWHEESDPEGNTNDSPRPEKVSKTRKKGDKGTSRGQIHLESTDYTVLALNFLEGLEGAKSWDEPPRTVHDPFVDLQIPDNPIFALPPEQIPDYLPNHPVSIEFKVKTDSSRDGNYHRLNWFEGESYDISYGRNPKQHLPASILHTGGPILSISFHPSGKFLAISVGRSYTDECDSLSPCPRPGTLQIYRRSKSMLSLQLVLGLSFGYATHIQWSSFCPDIIDSFDPTVASCFADIEIYARLGYIATACEDPIVRLFSICIQDIKAQPNFEYKTDHKIAVYNKSPEVELHPNIDDTGNAIRFDWHEENKYFCVGYGSGYVALFDLTTTSPLLMEKQEGVCVVNPFWIMHAHRQAVRGVLFDPKDPRYFVTCGQDRQLKVWDTKTRQERENKRIGICLDLCWVRGWIHQEASFENIVAYQSAMHNYTRIFQTGSGVGKPSSAEVFNVTSLSCCNGLTAQGTDDGRVSVTYFDWFWRECDYERNRKKKNLAVLAAVEVDRNCYEKLGPDDFEVEVRKLRKNVINSKLWQRLAVNDEEGVYSVSLEAKFGNMNIYEDVPDVEEDEDEDSDSEEENDEVDKCDDPPGKEDEEEYNELMISEALSTLVSKTKDGLIPVFDMKRPVEKEPRITISLARIRPEQSVPSDGIEPNQVEEYIRFYSYIRVNKVAWSPSGDYIAVGYRNGLLTLLPGSFETIFH